MQHWQSGTRSPDRRRRSGSGARGSAEEEPSEIGGHRQFRTDGGAALRVHNSREGHVGSSGGGLSDSDRRGGEQTAGQNSGGADTLVNLTVDIPPSYAGLRQAGVQTESPPRGARSGRPIRKNHHPWVTPESPDEPCLSEPASMWFALWASVVPIELHGDFMATASKVSGRIHGILKTKKDPGSRGAFSSDRLLGGGGSSSAGAAGGETHKARLLL